MAKEKAKKAKGKVKETWEAFKAFISRGSVLDLAVGVIIGGAFNAIVNAFVAILMSVCTWGVPGGISGLVTVLPAANPAQAGIEGIGQTFAATPDAITAAAETYAELNNLTDNIVAARTELLSKYTLHGSTYYYNNSAIIDWGTFINAIISFLIIAVTLFVIVRVFNYLQKKREALAAKAREEYYERHPEERPAPVAPDAPKPTELDVLLQIRDQLAKNAATAEAVEKKTE